MAISAAKLEANRRNARKSTGPRTEGGKDRSKMNALDHGCRAKTLVLPDEDPQALEDRQEAWSARFQPRDESEEYYLQDAVVNSWLLDRTRRAQTARLTENILNFNVERDLTIAREVAELGGRLFKDRIGPLACYPSMTTTRVDFVREPSTSFPGKNKGDDPDPPADILLSLQSTLLGCEWLLAEWAGLKAILDEGQAWLSSDKLKAVRLLGKQPFDALDDRDVAIVFLASFVLKGDKGTWYWEISNELAERDLRMFRANAATRELESLKPENAAKARESLLRLIERATVRLTLKADAHRERARALAALVPDLLAFDDSPAGERLRRYELGCGRAMSRSLDKMLRLASCPLPVVSCEAQTIAQPIAPNEPTDQFVSCPLSVVSCDAGAPAEPIAPNEPTEPVVRCPLPVVSCEAVTLTGPIAPNEPTDTRQDATNEPTEPPTTNNGHRTAGAGDRMTNEPALAVDSDGDKTAEPNTVTDTTDDGEFYASLDTAGRFKWMRNQMETLAAYQAEAHGKSNEENRNEGNTAGAVRLEKKLQRSVSATSMIP
jgi:hypothetical protein